MKVSIKPLLFLPVFFFLSRSPALSDGSLQADGSGPNPGSFLVSIYRNHISSVDGHECPSVPSCSSYSIAAFKKHGFFIGWMMTVDRLIHEGREESRVSPQVYSHGKWKILDPVENNDFWWFPPNRKRHE